MEQQPRLPLWFLVTNCAVIALAFVAGTWIGSYDPHRLPQPQGRALGLIHAQILESHVEPQDGNELLDRAIGAMVQSLDDYSRYVPPTRVAEYEESTTGRYEGVGMVMTQHGEDMVVHFPFHGGPADRAGILPGDKVVAVDGASVYDLPSAERSARTTDLVRGPADSTVALGIDRDGAALTVTLERAAVQRPVVKWTHLADRERGLGYLHLTDFHRDCAAQVEAAIRELMAEGPLRGLVFDLRFDGGGSLDECIALCRMFQPTGVIVSTRRRGAELERVEAVAAECRFPDLPLVLLVNADSASASEVLAGCLQDHGRAAVVGSRTFGKGMVNTVYSWQDFKLKLTTAHFYTPNGKSLGGSHRSENGGASGPDAPGIAPDEAVEVTPEQDLAILRTLRAHETPKTHRAAFARVAERYGVEVAGPPRADADPQLARALEVLGQRAATPTGR